MTLELRRDADSIAAQHAKGRLTAGERLEVLLDPGSFEVRAAGETALLAGSGLVNGRRIFVYATDATIADGALAAADMQSLVTLYDAALEAAAPIIGLFDGRGVLKESEILAALGRLYTRAAAASGKVPMIALIAGPCIGAAAILAAASSFVFMTRPAAVLFVTGPDVVNALTHENLCDADLGGAAVHAAGGLADGIFENDLDALFQIRRLIDLLPAVRNATAPVSDSVRQSFDDPTRATLSLDSLVPEAMQAYDVKELLGKILDEEDVFEIKEHFARNLVTAFGRIGGRTVGVIAQQPIVLAGVYDCAALEKAARFIALCEALQLPILTCVDAPGFLPGLAQEQGGIARRAADLARAYAAARVPKITLVLRNALGQAFAIAGSKELGADRVFAWPSARIAVSGTDKTADLQSLAACGLIDAIIEPRHTRRHIAEAFSFLRRSAAD